MTRQNNLVIAIEKHRQILAKLSNPRLKNVSQRAQEANQQLTEIAGAMRPWEGETYDDRMGSEMERFRQIYADKFNVDLVDPKFKEWERAAIDKLRAERAQNKTVDPEEEIRQAIRKQAKAKGRR